MSHEGDVEKNSKNLNTTKVEIQYFQSPVSNVEMFFEDTWARTKTVPV